MNNFLMSWKKHYLNFSFITNFFVHTFKNIHVLVQSVKTLFIFNIHQFHLIKYSRLLTIINPVTPVTKDEPYFIRWYFFCMDEGRNFLEMLHAIAKVKGLLSNSPSFSMQILVIVFQLIPFIFLTTFIGLTLLQQFLHLFFWGVDLSNAPISQKLKKFLKYRINIKLTWVAILWVSMRICLLLIKTPLFLKKYMIFFVLFIFCIRCLFYSIAFLWLLFCLYGVIVKLFNFLQNKITKYKHDHLIPLNFWKLVIIISIFLLVSSYWWMS